MTNLWNFLVNFLLGRINGLKSVIGTVGVILTFLLGTILPWLQATFPALLALPWLASVITVLEKIFGALAAVGIVHRLQKIGDKVGV